jgi:hypothetical protein
MGKRGPKLTQVNWELCANLLRIQCTGEEIAGAMGMSYDTLERACKRDNDMKFAEYSELKRAEGKASLRRAQWKAAQDGNPTMLVWLGKQMLGQTDRNHLDHTSSDGSMTPTAIVFQSPELDESDS